VKPACNGTARNQTFSVAGSFRLIRVLEVRIPGTIHVFRNGEVSVMPSSAQDEFTFLIVPFHTGFRYAKVPFKTGLTYIFKECTETNLLNQCTDTPHGKQYDLWERSI
jgi:hypothetical protein